MFPIPAVSTNTNNNKQTNKPTNNNQTQRYEQKQGVQNPKKILQKQGSKTPTKCRGLKTLLNSAKFYKNRGLKTVMATQTLENGGR